MHRAESDSLPSPHDKRWTAATSHKTLLLMPMLSQSFTTAAACGDDGLSIRVNVKRCFAQ